MLHETVWRVHAFLHDDYRLIITDMWREMAAHFSHEANEVTIVSALQQIRMQKVCACDIPRQLMEEHQKTCMEVALIFLTQCQENGNDLLEQKLTSNESIHF